MINKLSKLKNKFEKFPDLIIKEIKSNWWHKEYLIYIESLCSADRINNYVLKAIADKDSLLPGPHIISISEEEIDEYLFNGYCILVNNDFNKVLAIETKADLDRPIGNPESQPSPIGPKDAFNENYLKNLGLIRRRVKSTSLKNEEILIGERTKTRIGIIYFDDIANDELINKLKAKLEQIDVDAIIDSSYLIQYLTGDIKFNFPLIMTSERPDKVVSSLLNGKVALIVDNTPFVLILPMFLADFINPIIDEYGKAININIIKITRFFCFIITLIAPAFYIALTNYNQEAIPTSLLINISMQRDNVPFPAIIEALAMLFMYQALRESDLRFPKAYGSAITVFGALILGEAAVSAGFVSPIMIIVIASTFLTSLIFTENEKINAIRAWRYVFLFAASILGIYGLFISIIFFTVKILTTSFFDYPYSFPIAPFDKTYFTNSLVKKSPSKEKYRSKWLAAKNIVRRRLPNEKNNHY